MRRKRESNYPDDPLLRVLYDLIRAVTDSGDDRTGRDGTDQG
ncbi:MAG: hypothetical protein QXS20_10750 [Candidatus Thorarchaeota archaeon]